MSYIVEKDWTTKAGLRAVVTVCQRPDGTKRHRCGYVGVPENNNLFNIEYNKEINLPQEIFDAQPLGKKSAILALTACVINGESTERVRKSPDILFDCHGGLTYSGKGDYPVKSDLWWFGFDCAHCDDLPIEQDNRFGFERYGVVRSLAYVEAECEDLAKQIVTYFPNESKS